MRRNLWWMMGPLREGEPEGGGGGGGAPAFDAAKFRAEIMGEVSKAIKAGLSPLEASLKGLTPPPPDDGGEGEGDGGGKGKTDPKLARQIAKLNADLEAERNARKESETKARETNRVSTIKGELAKHVAPDKLDAALRIFGPDVRVAEDGTIVGGSDDMPVAEYLAEAVKAHEYLMPPRQVGGAGAAPGNGRRGSDPLPSLDDIKPGMAPETRAKIMAAIAAFTPNGR